MLLLLAVTPQPISTKKSKISIISWTTRQKFSVLFDTVVKKNTDSKYNVKTKIYNININNLNVNIIQRSFTHLVC